MGYIASILGDWNSTNAVIFADATWDCAGEILHVKTVQKEFLQEVVNHLMDVLLMLHIY